MDINFDIEKIRQRARRTIQPLRQVDLDVNSTNKLLISARRTNAGRKMPPYYLIYFLLIDLLGFRNNGKWEKTAWSVSVEYNDITFMIEHRKFGLGVFGMPGPETEAAAEQLVTCLFRAVKVAQPYFDWRAEDAARKSHLNVLNRSGDLFDHLYFYLDLYEKKMEDAEARGGEVIKTQLSPNSSTIHYPSNELKREARHYAIAAIEGFFSWTEHVFIHIAILRGLVSTGKQVGDLSKSEWSEKYKTAINITIPSEKLYYDDLSELRRQLRNFVAHGSFGKNGEALQFHSGAGAVPMLLPHKKSKTAYRFGSGLDFLMEPSIFLIKKFAAHIWTGERSPAKIYIQDYQLPAVLTFVEDGTYDAAMRSDADMSKFASFIAESMDNAANMDF